MGRIILPAEPIAVWGCTVGRIPRWFIRLARQSDLTPVFPVPVPARCGGQLTNPFGHYHADFGGNAELACRAGGLAQNLLYPPCAHNRRVNVRRADTVRLGRRRTLQDHAVSNSKNGEGMRVLIRPPPRESARGYSWSALGRNVCFGENMRGPSDGGGVVAAAGGPV